jgi:hypothetical protein
MPKSPHTVQYLYLLMGDNPLPNAVAALTLLQPEGVPYLVHTHRTRLAAERLQAVLQEFPHVKPGQLLDLQDFQSDAFEIEQRIQTSAMGLTGTVGINYTGGTKVMSVHATRAITAVHPNAVLSYLDSNSLEMLIERPGQPSVRLAVAPNLQLDQLFRLHGLVWRTEEPPCDRPIQPEAASKLAHFHQYPELSRVWRGWCNRVLRRAAKNDHGHWRTEAELRALPPLPLTDLPPVFHAELWRDHFRSLSTLSLANAPDYGFASSTQLCEWLDGIWLEHYTLSQIQRLAPTLNIHDPHLGFRLRDAQTPTSQWDKFEFDVAFMHHYQLFALSCTTSDRRGLCKQKLLEASVRAKQLGGTEARVGLVCGYQAPASLRSELEVAARDKRIAVFGRSDFRNLGQKIATWVKQNG